MNVQIVTVGKLKESFLTEGVAEYAKRLRPYAKLQIIEVADEKAPETMSAAEEQRVKRLEGERILTRLHPEAYVVALAVEGKLMSSDELAEHLQSLATYGRSQFAFVIGGSTGLSDEVLRRADLQLSFGRLTYPHQLMRLIVLEQIYRVCKIMRGEPYHR